MKNSCCYFNPIREVIFMCFYLWLVKDSFLSCWSWKQRCWGYFSADCKNIPATSGVEKFKK